MNEQKLRQDESQNSKGKDREMFVGICPAHNWEGFRRESITEAQLDLDGHTGLFPDESHSGAQVIPVEA